MLTYACTKATRYDFQLLDDKLRPGREKSLKKDIFRILVQTSLTVGQFWTIEEITPTVLNYTVTYSDIQCRRESHLHRQLMSHQTTVIHGIQPLL